MSLTFRRVAGQPQAAPRTYSEELGWTAERTAQGIVYKGNYLVRSLRYQGWVLQQDRKLQFYILNPPIQLLRETNFGACFHIRNDGWWLISFKPHDIPADLASGVAGIQKTLHTAFETRETSRRATRT